MTIEEMQNAQEEEANKDAGKNNGRFSIADRDVLQKRRAKQ